MKKISDIFSDYECKGNIKDAIIENVVLKKKTNALDINIISDEYIQKCEVEQFNAFIKNRFKIKYSNIVIKYTEKLNEKTIEDTKEIAVQVNGKVRGTIEINIEDDENSIKEKALDNDNVSKHIEGKDIVKIIVIKGKIVNIVVK